MNFGTLSLKVFTVKHDDTHFNCKIVISNLEEIIKVQGLEIKRVETRESGRGTPIALRVLTKHFKSINTNIDSVIEVIDNYDSHFNKKIVFLDLENGLRKEGLHVQACETRKDGQGTPIGIRIKV